MIEIDIGNTRGIVRKIDDLGRVVLPSEFRKELGLKPRDEVSIYLLNDGFYVKKKQK